MPFIPNQVHALVYMLTEVSFKASTCVAETQATPMNLYILATPLVISKSVHSHEAGYETRSGDNFQFLDLSTILEQFAIQDQGLKIFTLVNSDCQGEWH